MFHISIWGGLELCLGGLSPPKPPRGDGTACYTYCTTFLQYTPISFGQLHIMHEQVLSIQKTQPTGPWVWRHYADMRHDQLIILTYMEARQKTLALPTRNLNRWIKLNFMNSYDINCWRIIIELILYRHLTLYVPQFSGAPWILRFILTYR